MAFVGCFFVYGIGWQDATAIDVAKYLTPFTMGGATAAFWRKHMEVTK